MERNEQHIRKITIKSFTDKLYYQLSAITISLYIFCIFVPVLLFENSQHNKHMVKSQTNYYRRILHDLKTPIACIKASVQNEKSKELYLQCQILCIIVSKQLTQLKYIQFW